MSTLDIGFLIIVFFFFVKGYRQGFLLTLLNLLALVISVYIVINHTTLFLEFFKDYSFIVSSPLLLMVIVYAICAVFMYMAKISILRMFNTSGIFYNPLMKLLGGVLYVFQACIVLAAFAAVLTAKGYNLNERYESYPNSYLGATMNYINGGFDLAQGVTEILVTAQQQRDALQANEKYELAE